MKGGGRSIEGILAEDEKTLKTLGYEQELHRRMSAFSNLAISLSIICILAGGVTSFHQGLSSVGGAAIGLGWPLVCLFSLTVALTMGHVASAFPTAGGLYHWASILGGKGWGWGTAWFNLVGLIATLAAINLGAITFVQVVVGPLFGYDYATVAPATKTLIEVVGMIGITVSQALVNHLGIRLTTKLTDFSGWWILGVSAVLAAAVLGFAQSWHFERLVQFVNYSGAAGGDVWPKSSSLPYLFCLSFLLPAYTMTGFDASAHTAEETVGAARNVSKGIWRSVAISGVAGWLLLSAIVVAAPDLSAAAAKGDGSFAFIVNHVLPAWLSFPLFVGIALAQYLCGLATVTSASRMAYAFARDGGMPFHRQLRRVGRFRTPTAAIWTSALTAILFTLYTPMYETVAACCTLFMYVSYVVPTLLGFFAHGKSWTAMGPWSLGRWYRPLALVAVLGCAFLILVGVQPPNEKATFIVGGGIGLLCVVWFAFERKRFLGPPEALMARA